MIDFRLNDRAEIELVHFAEETTDFIWDQCYPALNAVMTSDDAARSGQRNLRTAHKIKRAVERAKKALNAQATGTPAKTEVGRELQKRLRTVGPVADHYFELAATEILRR